MTKKRYTVSLTITTDYDKEKLREVLVKLIGDIWHCAFAHNKFKSFVFTVDEIVEDKSDDPTGNDASVVYGV